MADTEGQGKMTKRSSKVPEPYQSLAKAGFRVRFSGFWLGDSARDRMIADWLDQTPGAGSIIKNWLYDWISGRQCAQRISYEDLANDPIDEIGDAGSALLDLED